MSPRLTFHKKYEEPKREGSLLNVSIFSNDSGQYDQFLSTEISIDLSAVTLSNHIC